MGCFKSKSVKYSDSDAVLSSTVVAVPTPNRDLETLSPQEIQDVVIIMEILRAENIEMVVTARMFDRLFDKSPDVKKMFLNSAFLESFHTLDCYSDPWFQGFLKAYVNTIIKYITLQEDEAGLNVFITDFKEIHQRVRGIKVEHVEFMVQYLYTEVVNALGRNIDRRQRKSWKHLMFLLGQTGLKFLPIATMSAKSTVSQTPI